jgi:hypothetical protein
MREVITALLMLTVGVGAVSAADLRAAPVKAPPMVQTIYNWTGFYLGVTWVAAGQTPTWISAPPASRPLRASTTTWRA